jgi:beta-glucosidase-like glycosyl hydrolase
MAAGDSGLGHDGVVNTDGTDIQAATDRLVHSATQPEHETPACDSDTDQVCLRPCNDSAVTSLRRGQKTCNSHLAV